VCVCVCVCVCVYTVLAVERSVLSDVRKDTYRPCRSQTDSGAASLTSLTARASPGHSLTVACGGFAAECRAG